MADTATKLQAIAQVKQIAQTDPGTVQTILASLVPLASDEEVKVPLALLDVIQILIPATNSDSGVYYSIQL